MVTGGLRRLPGKGRRGKWSPFTLHGQTNLAETVSALKKVNNTNNTRTADKHLKDSTVESPAERRFRKKLRPFKSEPLPEHESRYASNPWAQMLASPQRMCLGSRMRFPTALMTDYTLHTDEDGAQKHLLPADLADLPKFKAALSSDDPVTEIINRKYTGNAGRTSRVLSYDFLLESMTNKFQAWDKKTKTSKTKEGVILGRLLPPRWTMAAQKMRDYRTASKDYFAELTARKAEGQDNLGEYAEDRKPVSLKSLHWRPDMVQRIANAMRMRIVIALDELSRHKEQIVYTSVPERAEAITIPADGVPVREYWNDMGDIESPTALSASLSSTNRQGNPSDDRPPIAVSASEISQDPPMPYPPPGTIILHTGSPLEFQIMLEDLHQQDPHASPPANAYIPPTLLVNTTRHPIFNIQALLTPALLPELSHILSALSTDSSEDRSADTSGEAASQPLLLVPATSPMRAVLTHEMWQLWRFQGGTAGLQASIGTDDAPKLTTGPDAASQAEISDAQKEHLRSVMGWEGKHESD